MDIYYTKKKPAVAGFQTGTFDESPILPILMATGRGH